jgi:hypothetical protein
MIRRRKRIITHLWLRLYALEGDPTICLLLSGDLTVRLLLRGDPTIRLLLGGPLPLLMPHAGDLLIDVEVTLDLVPEQPPTWLHPLPLLHRLRGAGLQGWLLWGGLLLWSQLLLWRLQWSRLLQGQLLQGQLLLLCCLHEGKR